MFAKSLAGMEYDVYVENYRLQELDKALQSFTLRLVDEFCHVNSKQVIMRCCSYNLGLIVRTSDVCKFCHCTRQRMITYTNVVASILTCT